MYEKGNKLDFIAISFFRFFITKTREAQFTLNLLDLVIRLTMATPLARPKGERSNNHKISFLQHNQKQYFCV